MATRSTPNSPLAGFPRRLYAHRGAAAEQPENTMPSFRRALELGATALETDAHLTADGHVVLSHDPGGARMAGVGAEIRRSRLAEVRRWDVGYGFVDDCGDRPFAGRGFHIPTLEELLVELPGIPINVDLKQRRPSMVVPVLDLLDRLGATDRVTLASFHLATLLEVRARGYRGATGLSRPEVAALLAAPASLCRLALGPPRAAQLPDAVGRLVLGRPALIAKCHRVGLRVDFWTINQPERARRLLELGADGIMTDDPATIGPVFYAHEGRPAAD